MDTLREISRWTHVIIGFAGLLAFWFPVFARKGGKLHVLAGKVFVVCGYLVTGTAIFSCLLITGRALANGQLFQHPQEMGFVIFLAYLALLTFTTVHHSVRVVETRRDRAALDTTFHRGLAWTNIVASVCLLAYTLGVRTGMTILFLFLAPAGWGAGRSILRYLDGQPNFPRAWFYEHMGGMLGAGIAFHTAFAVFGSRRLFGLEPSGVWGFLPWILPSLIGIPASALWDSYYRRKFRDPSAKEALAGATGATGATA